MAGIFGGGNVPLSGTDPISPWGGYTGNQIGDTWRGAQGGMSGTDPISQWGGYTGNQIGNAWSQAQQEPSLWDKLSKAIGETKPEDLAKKSQELLAGNKSQPLIPPNIMAAHAAGTMNPYLNPYARLAQRPLDPKQALLTLQRGGYG